MAELVETYYDNNKTQLKEKYYKINGNKFGEYIGYSKYGKIVANYVDNKLHGEFRQYHDNGELCELSYFVNGELNGLYKSFFRNKQLWIISNYLNGQRHSEYKEYYPSGNLEAEYSYTNGKITGIYKSYYDIEPQQLKLECNYLNDIQNGEYKSYSPSGILDTYFKNIDDNKRDCTEYWKNGNIREKYITIDGKIDGERQYYDISGKLYIIKYYIKGKLTNKYIAKSLSIMPSLVKNTFIYFL